MLHWFGPTIATASAPDKAAFRASQSNFQIINIVRLTHMMIRDMPLLAITVQGEVHAFVACRQHIRVINDRCVRSDRGPCGEAVRARAFGSGRIPDREV